jgi:YVTN family beta-propeller protein
MYRRSFLTVAALAACGRRRGSGFPGYAFVANEQGHAIAVVDLTAFAVARHIRLDAAPTGILSHPTGGVCAVGGPSGQILEIRAGDLALGRRLRVAGVVSAARFAPAGDAIWVLCPEVRHLARVALEPFRVTARVTLPAMPHDLDISPDGRWAAVSLAPSRGIAFVDLAAGRVARMANDGAAAGFVRFRSDGGVLMAANPAEKLLSIFENPSGRLVVHLPLAVAPRSACFKSDGGQLFISGDGLDAVVTVYPYQTDVGATMLAGRAPGALAASASPAYLFVANPTSGDVTILNIQTQRVIGVAPVGREPCHIAVTPDNQYALVLNRGSGDMAVLRIPAITANRARSAPLFTMIPVGSRPVSAVVRAV